MPFNKSDYNDVKLWSKIHIILNDLIEVPLNTPFVTLTIEQMTQYNQAMVDYIGLLPDEGYLEVIQKDFLLVVDSIKV